MLAVETSEGPLHVSEVFLQAVRRYAEAQAGLTAAVLDATECRWSSP